MASLKSRMINMMIRNSYLFRGKLKKETFDMNTSIDKFREDCEKGAARYAKLPEGVEVKEQIIEGIKSEWLIPEGAHPEKLIMYVHGGGYVSGSCSDHRGFVSKFAKNTGVANLVFEYRLAPENPFSAALEDSVKVYRWLLYSGYKPENLIIAGESAGGGLTLATLLALKDQGIPLPKAGVAISPWTDLTCSGESYRTKNKVSPAPIDSWHVFARHYAGDKPLNLPLISPLFGDLKGLPPLLINSGMDDELYDDGRLFAEKARSADVEVTFKSGGKMLHCYPLLAPMFPEATEAMNEIVDFIRHHLKILPEFLK
jgi:epsilon-lactone hydrolase